MIDQLYNNIDLNENIKYDDYLLSLNGSVFKKINDANIALNQKSLTPFYMWATSGSVESSAIITSFDQYRYLLGSSVDFSQLSRNNKNAGNSKIKYISSSLGYVLSDKTLRYDTNHNGILYYYGYGNFYGYGTPFNITTSLATEDIPQETKNISPSKISYYAIKNILSDDNFIKNGKIQVTDSFFIEDFVYLKIPRNIYHEEILKGSFEISLASGSKLLNLADVNKYNISYNEPNIVYLVSASNQTDVYYVSGNLDVYGLIDRKNAIILIDTRRLNDFFGENTFVTNSFESSIKTYNQYIYVTESFGVVYVDSIDSTPYTASYYPNIQTISKLLYSGSLYKNLKAIGLETQVSDVYYIKIGPGEFNRSTNPTYLNNWRIKNEFILNPISYITTIGLYNDFGDCLAIAKLSKPLKNDYESSYVIKLELKQ